MKRIAILVLLGAAVVAGVAWLVLGRDAAGPSVVQQGSQKSAQPSASARAVPVEVAPIEVGRVEQEIEALGTLAANESVVIVPEIAGLVTKLGFEEGSPVQGGQILVELDATILNTELKQNQAELNLARGTFERARQLAQRGAGTQVALEQATAQLAAAEAKVANVQARLEKTTINAPFDGVVGLRAVAVGDYVSVGQNLVTVTDLDPIKVEFRVPETFLTRIKDGQEIQIAVDAIPGRNFRGRIFAIDPVVDVNGRAIRLRAVVDNPQAVLKPGLFARVTIITDSTDSALLVPETAVLPNGNEKAVFVVDDGKARLTNVTIGKRLPGKVQVTSGLAADMQVITTGQMRLRDGASIAVAGPRVELQK